MQPIHVNYFIHNNEKIYLKERVLIQPYRSEHNELWLVDCEEFGICTHAYTKKEMKSLIYELFSICYEFYALEEDSKLTKGALKIKNKLLESIYIKGD